MTRKEVNQGCKTKSLHKFSPPKNEAAGEDVVGTSSSLCCERERLLRGRDRRGDIANLQRKAASQVQSKT